jgi:hypothetical protein
MWRGVLEPLMLVALHGCQSGTHLIASDIVVKKRRQAECSFRWCTSAWLAAGVLQLLARECFGGTRKSLWAAFCRASSLRRCCDAMGLAAQHATRTLVSIQSLVAAIWSRRCNIFESSSGRGWKASLCEPALLGGPIGRATLLGALV